MADPDGALNVLQFCRPPDGATMSLITTRLDGHATSGRWLPEGLWPDLDEIRTEHLRVRALVAADLRKLRAIASKYAEEDRQLAVALQEGHRTGVTPKVNVTPEERRDDERRTVEASLWAGCRVLADVVDKVRRVLVEHEAAWLAQLGQTEQYDAKIRELEEQLEAARRERWRNVQLARWLKAEVQGGAFGHQPAPNGEEPMSPQFDLADHRGAFERSYHERDLVRPLPPANDDPLDLEVEDGDGTVRNLSNETAEGVGSIEPLDDEVRFGAAR